MFIFNLLLFLNLQTSSMESEKKFGEIFTIKPTETVTFNNGYLKITFVTHGHKIMFPNTGPSPLIIHLEYEFDNKIYTKIYNKYDLPFIWRWKDFLFVVTEYQYNEFMKMKVEEQI